MKNMNETTAPESVRANGSNHNVESSASALSFEELLARYDVPRPVAFGQVVQGTILPYGDNAHFSVGDFVLVNENELIVMYIQNLANLWNIQNKHVRALFFI